MMEVPTDYSDAEPETEEPDGQEFYVKWTDAYKEAREYLYGTLEMEPDEEAAKRFGMASAKEHKYALCSLGMLYLHGKGVEQDEEKACQLFQRSHKKGNPYASFELGKLYEAGRGTEQNTNLAEKCYRVAFRGFLNLEKKSKDDTLWYRIGTMYLHGVGTEADEKEAEKYLRKSADYGNIHAAYQLAKLYIRQETEKPKQNPEEVPDYEKIGQALNWLKAASKQGNPFAD